MSEAAEDQGWHRPSRSVAAQARAELEASKHETPVEGEAGVNAVRETRRRLEAARRAELDAS